VDSCDNDVTLLDEKVVYGIGRRTIRSAIPREALGYDVNLEYSVSPFLFST